ncbi:hypothetical protein LZD49_35300 [Dyadobacter sp. CY261]|uniref:hypothetical protein n=1 Tax=Dyadobacter sp. CY261 TaxID=2907203 RepID=UPI001F3932CC|nr:hypothetical protein [Dyadobacter sp. CY261]MCF0075788.1 hypothetical protein [Dyadobacter sp. CY261]
MKDLPWKIATAVAISILIIAIALWIRGFRQKTPNPDAKSFADTIRENIHRANQHADTAQKHQQDYEADYHKYDNWRADPSVRDSLGARIWRDVQAKDSL